MGTFPFIIAQLVIIVKTNSVHSGTGASSSLKAGTDSIIEVHFGCNANEHFIGGFHLYLFLLISFSITLRTSKFRNQFTISSKYSELVRSDVISLNLKRDRTRIGLSF